MVRFAKACLYGHVPMTRQLIAEGIDINGRLNSGYTGLQCAINAGKREIVNLLLTCPDIDVNVKDENGETALIAAVWDTNTEVVRRILSRGDNRLDNTDHEGYTVLHHACRANKETYVQMVLAHPSCNKAIVNKVDVEGDTAETYAERRGYHGCVRMIREYLTREEGQDDVDGARRIEKMTLGSENSEALSSSELDAVIEDFEAVEVTFKEATNARANQMRAEISGLENMIKTQKQLLGEFELKSAADLAGIVKKKEDLKTLKRRRSVDPTPQTGTPPVQIPECPVCYERMTPPKQIFTCGNGHVICSECKTRINETGGNNRCINQCGARYTGRATTVEQMIREMMGHM